MLETEFRHATHEDVPPLINDNCDTLVLGSMLSPKSAQARFYYAHPQNRFWRVFGAVFDRECPENNIARAELALENGIALWDVIESCDIVGAADSTIRNVVYNDIAGLINKFPKITRIFTTGGKAHELLMRYNSSIDNPMIARAMRLPSTSPLNCAAKFDALVCAYSVLRRGGNAD